MGTAVELPAEIEAARAILRKQGLAVDPRRIDVYQFGVVLCQLLTGESLVSYRYSTSVKARVPHSARAVLDRCLGEGATPPLANCEGLAEALQELLWQCGEGLPPSSWETPARGSGVDYLAPTPPQGSVLATAGEIAAGDKLPFERWDIIRSSSESAAAGWATSTRATKPNWSVTWRSRSCHRPWHATRISSAVSKPRQRRSPS